MGYGTPRTTPTVIQTARGLVDGRFGAVVSVTEHGAAGDGATDDRAAIQAAINAVNAAGGGTVLLPIGTYLLGSATASGRALELKSGVALVGAGWGSVLKASPTMPASTAMIGTDPLGTISDWRIADLQLDGNQGNRTASGLTSSSEDEGINIKGVSSRGTIANVYIHDVWMDAIDFDGGASSTDSLIVGCVIEDNGGNGMHNGTVNTLVLGCTFRRNCARRGGGGTTNAWASNLNFANSRWVDCVFEDNWSGPVMDQAAAGRAMIGCTVTGSTNGEAFKAFNGAVGRIIGNRLEAEDGYVALNIGSGTGVCVVADNEVTGSDLEAIKVEAPGSTVTGNVVSGGTVGIYVAAGGINVSGNSVSGASSFGIRAQSAGTTSGTISGNDVTGAGGLNVRFSATGLLISGNRFAGTAVETTGGNTLMGNVFGALTVHASSVARNNVVGGAFVADSNA